MVMNPEFWRKRRILITGHTGFKGSWLALWLESLGAKVVGYSLEPPTQPNFYELANLKEGMESIHGNILDLEHLRQVMGECQPDVVFHLAAQSLVRRSYVDPVGTYATNVLGTVHVLEAARPSRSLRAVVIVTTDKCYENGEGLHRFCETDRLGGVDPYSSSKAAAELVTAAFRHSYFTNEKGQVLMGLASARAGNVIGGGDWGTDRLLPDVMRSVLEGKELIIRKPHAIRPWQHVLEPLCGYLTLAEKLCQDPTRFSSAWNFGPSESEDSSVLAVLEKIRELWGARICWRADTHPQPLEASYLRLDCGKAKTELGWQPQWTLRDALNATVQWYQAFQRGEDVRTFALQQIHAYQMMLNKPEISVR